MRAVLAFAVLLAGVAQPALAAPDVSRIRVSIGPELAKKTNDIGARDLDILVDELRRTVARKTPPRPGGGTLDLVIEDAKPNRPTPQQMSNTLGLSLESFGNGGARISGQYVDAAGVRTPIAYGWYGTDIRWARHSATWHDAGVAFDRLADRLAKDQFSDRH